MIVLDASAYVMAATESTITADRLLDRINREQCHSPHLIDAEIGQALRRLAMRSVIDDDTAEDALNSAAHVIDERHEIFGVLSSIAWTLRHRVSFYDALYVALAITLDAPLVTADARLSRTPLPCAIELVAA